MLWYYKEIFVFVFLIGIGIALDLPSNFETCKRSDSDFNGCLKRAIQKVLPLLEKGIPELNLASGQPLFVKTLSIGEGKGTVHVVQNYNDVKIYNFFQLKIDSVDAKLTDKGFDLTMDASVDEIIVDSEYDFNGRILVLPIVGKGPCKIVFHKLKTHITLHGDEINKKGEAYYEIKNFNITLKPETISLNFQNLFNGDKRLGDEMNKVLNENWSAIWEDVKEAYELTMSLIFKNIATHIFNKVPHKQIFLE